MPITPRSPIIIAEGTPFSDFDTNGNGVRGVLNQHENDITDMQPVAVSNAAGLATVQTQVNVSHNSDGSQKAGSVPFAATAGIWWEEIGRTTLTVAGNTITVNSLPARRYLRLQIWLPNSGSIQANMRFNNDSAANYAYSYSIGGAADTTAISQTSMLLSTLGRNYPQFIVADIINSTSSEKMLTLHNALQNTAGAANVPIRFETVGKWANTTDKISRVDILNVSGGTFAVGSEVVVLGRD